MELQMQIDDGEKTTVKPEDIVASTVEAMLAGHTVTLHCPGPHTALEISHEVQELLDSERKEHLVVKHLILRWPQPAAM